MYANTQTHWSNFSDELAFRVLQHAHMSLGQAQYLLPSTLDTKMLRFCSSGRVLHRRTFSLAWLKAGTRGLKTSRTAEDFRASALLLDIKAVG